MMKVLWVAGALCLSTAAVPALAHDDHYYQDYFDHQIDHQEHRELHREFKDAHEEAHEEGFISPREHRAWHRAYEATHERFHEDHPGTRHDHDRYYYRPYRYDLSGYRTRNGPSFTYSLGY